MKFKELKYEHLDYEKLKIEFEEKLDRLKHAADIDGYLKIFK